MELKEFIAWIKSEGKMRELQSLADVLCEKQRESCKEEVRVEFFRKTKLASFPNNFYYAVQNAKQPKIEEL